MTPRDSTIDDHQRVLLAWALAEAIPAELRRWTGQATPEARVEELRDRLATVWDTYMLEVSERTRAQRWIASEALAASVCGYLAAPAEEEGWDEEEATIEAQQTLELIMGAEISMSALGGLPKLTPGALYTPDVLAEWLRWPKPNTCAISRQVILQRSQLVSMTNRVAGSFDGFTLVEPKTFSLSWYCQQG